MKKVKGFMITILALFISLFLLSSCMVNEGLNNKLHNEKIGDYYVFVALKPDYEGRKMFYLFPYGLPDKRLEHIYDISNVDKDRIEKVKSEYPLYMEHALPYPPYKLIKEKGITLYKIEHRENYHHFYMRLKDVYFCKITDYATPLPLWID